MAGHHLPLHRSSNFSTPSAHDPSPHHLSVAVVQHTHTMAAAPAIENAHRQLLDWNRQHRLQQVRFCHIVVIWADNASWCHDMQAVLSFTENVTCTGSAAIGEALPALENIFRIRGQGLPHTGSFRPHIHNHEWSWNNCDASYLWWATNSIDATNAQDYYWFLEWDLAWSGRASV